MFIPTTGAKGVEHRSAAEAAISYKFNSLGIVAREIYYPMHFTDSEGTPFKAMSDFQCPYTGIFFEFKTGHMNGLKTKANADKALARFQADLAAGFINPRNHGIKLLDASWSASAQKFKAVQYQASEVGVCVVLIFDKKPEAKTASRLNKCKVFWCIYGDERFRALMSFRTLARHGFRAQYVIDGHVFKAHGGLLEGAENLH